MNLGIADLYFFYNALFSLCLNKIIHFERTGDQDHDTTGKIGQCSVNSKTCSNTYGSDQSGDAAGFDSQIADQTNNNKDLQSDLADINESLSQCLIEFRVILEFLCKFLCYKINDLKGDEQDDQCNNDLHAGMCRPINHCI